MSRVNIVTGPPGAGKNTWVNKNFKQGDILIDLDAIYSCIAKNPSHCEKDKDILAFSLDIRQYLYSYVRRYIKDRTIWIVACVPNGRKREMLARTFENAKVYVLKTTKEKCLDNIHKDKTRIYSSEYAKDIVEDWYKKYSPSRIDKEIQDN